MVPLTDTIVGTPNNVLNTYAAARYVRVGIGADAYHVLGLRYADDVEYDVSNWSVNAGTALASPARHVVTAAPPRTVIATVALYFCRRRLVTTVALAVLRAGASGRPRSASSRRAPTRWPAPRVTRVLVFIVTACSDRSWCWG